MSGENANSMVDETTAPTPDGTPVPASGDQAPEFDESAFIRRAERRSIRRTLRVSLGVVLATVLVLALAWMGWRTAIDRQAQRILDYYPTLFQMTMANNHLEGGRVQRDFPGASMTLCAYRRVAGTVVPAGEVGVRFYPWGGESFTDPEHLGDITDGRLMLVPGTTPDLLFLEPPVGGGDASEIWTAGPESNPLTYVFTNARETSIAKLRSAPPSATVEAAVSFDDVMTLQELQKRLGGELRLAWGALRVGSAGEYTNGDTGVVHEAGTTWWPQFPASTGLVGVAFDATGESDGESPAEREASQLRDFGDLVRKAPWLKGRSFRKYSDYLASHGASYYGAVVIGSPEAVLELAESPNVSTVTLGAITMPWQ